MFNNQRVITSGIESTVPNYLQNILWYLIEIMEVKNKDYLQIFQLQEVNSEGKRIQKIIHSQEVPKYKNEHIISIEEPITVKIYAIDDGTRTTMLAEEY